MKKERRKWIRYDTQAKIYFRVSYDIKTRVKFRLINIDERVFLSKKYSGLSRNVCVDGLQFRSHTKLKKNDYLYIEVYLPKQKHPICMAGEAKWSKKFSGRLMDKCQFDTGVKLTYASGKPVAKSIYYDKKHHILWSIVLESIFGDFRKLMQRRTARPRS